jgi:hypothetical protein
MKFLLQKNIWQEYAYDEFLASIENAGNELQEVNIIPFTETLDPEVDYIPDYVFGSGRLVTLARKRKYPTFPSFLPGPYYFAPEDMVNGEGYDTTWGELKIDEPVFVKPYTEKFFTGLVIETQEDKGKVQLSTSFIQDENTELVRVSKPVKILAENRFFVIGGKIITGSNYREMGHVKHWRRDPGDYPWVACEEILKRGLALPSGFVIDVALLDDGAIKIVELNNLNSAGLYKCDTDAIVRALQLL